MALAVAATDEASGSPSSGLPWRAAMVTSLEAAAIALVVQDVLLFLAITGAFAAGSFWLWRFQRARRGRQRAQAGRIVVAKRLELPRRRAIRSFASLALFFVVLMMDWPDVFGFADLQGLGLLLLVVSSQWEFSLRSGQIGWNFGEHGFLGSLQVPPLWTLLYSLFGLPFLFFDWFVPREQFADHQWRTGDGSEALDLTVRNDRPGWFSPATWSIRLEDLTADEKAEIECVLSKTATEHSL